MPSRKHVPAPSSASARARLGAALWRRLRRWVARLGLPLLMTLVYWVARVALLQAQVRSAHAEFAIKCRPVGLLNVIEHMLNTRAQCRALQRYLIDLDCAMSALVQQFPLGSAWLFSGLLGDDGYLPPDPLMCRGRGAY